MCRIYREKKKCIKTKYIGMLMIDLDSSKIKNISPSRLALLQTVNSQWVKERERDWRVEWNPTKRRSDNENDDELLKRTDKREKKNQNRCERDFWLENYLFFIIDIFNSFHQMRNILIDWHTTNNNTEENSFHFSFNVIK